MKRTILFLALLLSSLGVFAQDFTYDGLNYSVISSDDHTCCVASNSRIGGAVTIPSRVLYRENSYLVTSIGDIAFYNCSLTSVTIPNSVTTIGNNAFVACNGLTSVTIPNSVTSIGSYAFGWCSGLTSVTIPNSVTSIGNGAFMHCSSLTSVTIPNSVTSIGNYAFNECYHLTSVTIPNSVTTIGESAFEWCSGLTSVTIPNSVTSIGNSVFYNCRGLTSVTIPNSVTSIGNWTFCGCSGLTSIVVETGNTHYNSRNNCNAIIETGTNTLICGCMNTTIPNSVTSIRDYAFEGCSGLTSMTIPNSVTSIGTSAFASCSGLTSVTIGNSVTSIGDYAFYGCSGLTSVTIPNSVTTIGNQAFYDCTRLSRVTVYAEQVPSLGNNALPSGITVYVPCASVSAYQSASGWSVLNIQCMPTYDLYYTFNGTSATVFGSASSGRVAIANNGTFNELNIPSSVTYNGTTYSVTTIGYNAFYNCSGLTSVTIPNSVTSIERFAFYGCSNVDTLYYNARNLTTTWHWYDYSSSYNSYGFRSMGLNHLVIGDSVQTLPDGVFYGQSGLTSVTIPNSVTSIGYSAFEYCTGLTSVTIGNSVTSIGSDAFDCCYGLTSVTIPNSVTYIGSSAFWGCSGLTSVTIPNSMISIGESAFYGCSQLTAVYDYSNLPITLGYRGIPQTTRIVKVLTDDRGDFNAPRNYIVDEVTYTRNYEQGNRSTLCLPFKPETVKVNGQPTTNLKFYEFADFDGTTITFNEVDFEGLAANTPYMVEWPASKTAQDFVFGATTNARIPATGDANSRTISHGDGKFIGTMARTCMNGSNYGYKNGYFVQSAEGNDASDHTSHAHVNPFRAYFEITTPSGSQGFAMPTELSVRFNTAEDNVGIDSVEPQQSNIRYSNDVYDMMGRMVRKNAESLDGLRKGVYIWKGEKKVVF